MRLDIEHQQNTTPFVFGTVYAGGKFLYDQPLVDPRASANRIYNRQALYFDYPLGQNLDLSAYWQRGHSTRSEYLVGFFDVLNAGKLRGYVRTIDESNRQSDFGIKLTGSAVTGPISHRWTVAAQHLGLKRDFAGPQNIGGFTLDVANPVFPANLAQFALSPRSLYESYTERGLGFANVAKLGNFEVRAGVRRSSYQLGSSPSSSQAQTAVADAAHTSASLGLGWQVSTTHRLWLGRASAFLPNRGRSSGGAFLPPSTSGQWEAGWQYKNQDTVVSLAAFTLGQSNLPARDPKDPDALILIGSNQSRGLEAKADFVTGPVRWQTAATLVRARVQSRTSPTQGEYLAGSPEGYGSVRASSPIGDTGLQAWLRLQAAASRPGDDKASFRAPGYGVFSMGLESAPTTPGARWGITVQNIADKRYVRALTGADNVWQGPRRSVQVWMEFGL